MSASRQDKPRQQTFHGPGSFGGDNKGVINNNVLLDPKTAAVMEDLNRKAPVLAALLSKALRDGIMSPDAVAALNRAVDHLNEDTAMAFRYAAQHINEETAISFEGVAHDFTVANQQLGVRVSELNNASEVLREMIGQINSTQRVGESGYQFPSPGSGRVANQPSVRSAANWWFRLQLMCFCLGAGLLTAAILAHYHLGGDAPWIGGLAAAVPLLIWAFKWWKRMSAKKERASGPPRPPCLPR